jgi:hypothetical protein
MIHWINGFAKQERVRRAKIEEFQDAATAIIGLIVSALESDAKVFHEEFPDTQVTIKPDYNTGSITVSCFAYLPTPEATVQLHSESQTITCEYKDRGMVHRDWKEQCQILKQGTTVEPEAARLSRLILKPLLFPAL